MKKSRFFALALSLAMCMSVGFSACGSNVSDDDEDDVEVVDPVDPDEEEVTPETPDEEEDTTTETPDEEEKEEEADEEKFEKTKTTLYVVGDSTVCSFSDAYYLPRYGYGTQLYNYLDSENVDIVNLALSGRSSLSFLSESNYTTLKESISSGDYLMIGFGHNDEKYDDSARFTAPTLNAVDTEGSFQYVLYNYYIKLCEDVGASPILCTPIVRYNASADYTGSSGHVVSGYGDYAECIRNLGENTGTTVVDLTEITKADYIALGEDAQNYHAFTSTKDGVRTGIDTTHINKYGAKMVAYEIATSLLDSKNTLKYYVNDEITKPSYDVDYADAINPDYVEPDYTAPDMANATSIGTVSDVTWYKSMIGTAGGASKVSAYGVSASDDTITIDCSDSSANGSKFSSTSDGFACAFIQIDVSTNFTATAKVKVTGLGSSVSSNSGFGMMLRDDMYLVTSKDDADANNTALTSNFVTAGTRYSSNPLFYRDNAASLSSPSTDKITPVVGDEYEISITRVGQACTVQFGNYTYTHTDFDFVAVDNDYFYLCLFSNRHVSVEFSNITYTVTGTSLGA